MSRIIREICDAMFEAAGEYLHPPSSIEERVNIARDFQETWNLPRVIGAIDGKHIRIQCPKQDGILFHNCKGFFSFVLLAICDARYRFTLFDVDQYDSNNDAGVLPNSSIGKKIGAGEMNIPPPRHLESCLFDPLPYYLVGDEISPLKTWLMRPYPGQLSEEKRILHYRLSRARRVIENTFGILAARWRIYHSPIIASIENAESYVLATIALHKYLRLTDNAVYTPVRFVDLQASSGETRPSEWRRIVDNVTGISFIPNVRGFRYSNNVIAMRETLKDYVNSETGIIEWQWDHVWRT